MRGTEQLSSTLSAHSTLVFRDSTLLPRADAGYQAGDTGGGAVVGFLSAAFSGPAGFSLVSGLVGAATGAAADHEGTMLGGALGGAVGSAMNANRGVRVLNPNSFYGSGFGQTVNAGLLALSAIL